MIHQWLQRMGRIPFVFILVGIALFFWINGPAFFPDWDATYGLTILYYIVMLVAFYIFSTAATEKKMDVPLSIASYQFVFGFILAYIVLALFVLSGFLSTGTMVASLVVPTLIIQFCVVSPAEELMFRGVLQAYTGILFQAFVFALWHSYAYGILWYNFGMVAGLASMVIAFIFGVLLGYLSRLPTFGLPGVIAIHGVYNCVILGALVM